MKHKKQNVNSCSYTFVEASGNFFVISLLVRRINVVAITFQEDEALRGQLGTLSISLINFD